MKMYTCLYKSIYVIKLSIPTKIKKMSIIVEKLTNYTFKQSNRNYLDLSEINFITAIEVWKLKKVFSWTWCGGLSVEREGNQNFYIPLDTISKIYLIQLILRNIHES